MSSQAEVKMNVPQLLKKLKGFGPASRIFDETLIESLKNIELDQLIKVNRN